MTIPYVFTAGTKIRSAQVNANFAAVEADIQNSLNIPAGLLPDNPTADNRPVILAGWTNSSLVYLPAGTYYISATIDIPDNKQLILHPDAVIKLGANVSFGSAVNIINHGYGSSFSGGTIDGNWTARVASGAIDSTKKQWTWGVFVQTTDTLTSDVTIQNCGCTAAELADSGGFGGNGGAVFLYLIVTGATPTPTDVTRNVVRNIKSRNPDAGFTCRMASEFTNIVENPNGKYLYGNVFDTIDSVGGLKNAIELAGPQVRYNKVIRVSVQDHRGFGGIEADFGAYSNLFDRCDLSFSPGFIWQRNWAGFSQRVTDTPGFEKYTRNNIFSLCSVVGGTQDSDKFVYGFQSVGPEQDGTDVFFENPTVTGQIVGPNATADRLVGIGINCDGGAVGNVLISNPMIKDGPERAIKIVGDHLVNSLTVRDGVLQSTLPAYQMIGPSTIGLGRLLIDGTRIDTEDNGVVLSYESVAQISNCLFENTASDKNCIKMPVLDNAFVHIENCDFTHLATGTFNPFSDALNVRLTTSGNMFGLRAPGVAGRGGFGRAFFPGNDSFKTSATAIGFTTTSSGKVWASAIPTAGTWAKDDAVWNFSPATRATPGWICVTAGTYGTLSGVTGSTTSGSPIATLSSTAGLLIGQWIHVAGAGLQQILTVDSTTQVTVTANYFVTTSGVGVVYDAPVWEEMAYLGAKTYTVVVQPSGGTLDSSGFGKTYTNEGASSISPFVLLTAAAGYQYSFIVQDADGIRVTAGAGDTIRDGASVSISGGKIESTTIGSSITIETINATEWIVTAKQGTWTVT